MDRFVDWHVEIMASEPIDILANTSWLPAALVDEYDTLWTAPRIKKVIDAALKYGIALEISSSYKLPKLALPQAGQGRRRRSSPSAPTAATRTWASSTTPSRWPSSST